MECLYFGIPQFHNQYINYDLNIGPRQDNRIIVDELNGKVEEARAKGVEDDTTKKRANEATKAKGKVFLYELQRKKEILKYPLQSVIV